VACCVALALAAPLSAAPGRQFRSTTLLYETPTADVLPACALAISGDLTYPLVQTPHNANYPEADVNFLFSPVNGLNIGLTGYTFTDWVLDLKYQILGGGDPAKFGLAVGVYDIGLNEYVSPIGHGLDAVWPDWAYNQYLPRYNRQTERFSAYAVTGIPVTKFARLNLGLGRGRFVGYDTRSKYLNSDIFFDEYHQWAVALLGGVELYVLPKVALVAEASSRDLNTGIKGSFGPVSATVAWTKMEGLLFSKGDDRFGRFDVDLTWQVNDFCGRVASLIPRRVCVPPLEPVPPPEPSPVPIGPPRIPMGELKLEPIWFEWDKWDITPEAATALRRNADVLSAHPELKVILAGYASEEGTPEHNSRLSGRRAGAVFEHLKTLGVPAEQMRIRAHGESEGRPYSIHRAVYFEVE